MQSHSKLLIIFHALRLFLAAIAEIQLYLQIAHASRQLAVEAGNLACQLIGDAEDAKLKNQSEILTLFHSGRQLNRLTVNHECSIAMMADGTWVEHPMASFYSTTYSYKMMGYSGNSRVA